MTYFPIHELVPLRFAILNRNTLLEDHHLCRLDVKKNPKKAQQLLSSYVFKNYKRCVVIWRTMSWHIMMYCNLFGKSILSYRKKEEKLILDTVASFNGMAQDFLKFK